MLNKEYKIVLAIVAVVFTIAFITAYRHPRPEIIYSKNDAVFADDDFSINVNGNLLQVGISSREEIAKLLPDGNNLGMSTIYQPKNLDCLLTFSKEKNILSEIHIETSELETSRGAKIGDSFAKIKQLYGLDYTLVKITGKPQDFDVVYSNGSNKTIVFQVRNNQVKKIILLHES